MVLQNEEDWDSIPDEELEETLIERIEGLKEMFPQGLRSGVSSTVDWTKWLATNTVIQYGIIFSIASP